MQQDHTTQGEGTDREGLADGVYRALLRSIISGEPAPGARLKERELSERFEVSRVPVRQALQRLESEGFVVTEPHRGAVVRSVTADDIAELFDARLCIEPFATRQAALRVHAGLASAARLAELLARSERHLAAGETAEGIESNVQFHAEMVRLSGNSLLVRSLEPMLGRMEWIFRLTHEARGESEHSLEHRQLLDAIVGGKAELAAAQAYAHIELGRRPILEALEPFLAV
ncbi:GntR family transcriptional regulator [Leifsonia sp. Root4]|uniref:GntR family transcriptional regulator n=1 Tax=Leifsonia sp. Root4 TaxID=1736525 RepID=UPI0009EAEC18|nr:GntR family transcriptional regulator [Leifsonia sp. Root4]